MRSACDKVIWEELERMHRELEPRLPAPAQWPAVERRQERRKQVRVDKTSILAKRILWHLLELAVWGGIVYFLGYQVGWYWGWMGGGR